MKLCKKNRFSLCKTILVVNFSVVSGGAALIATSSVSGLSLAPGLGGLLFGNILMTRISSLFIPQNVQGQELY